MMKLKFSFERMLTIFSLLLLLSIVAMPTRADTFEAGAYIIDMGVPDQNAATGLKPYGLVYALAIENFIPLSWAIRSGKLKNGISDDFDFFYNGSDFKKTYKGGSFIVGADFAAQAAPIIAAWIAKGVVVDGPTADSFAAPVYDTITSWPKSVLDTQNGSIAVTAFYGPSEVPTSSYRLGTPLDLTDCDDVYIMPHADPHDWDDITKTTFQSFINDGGDLFAGCHAVSSLEALMDFNNDGIPDGNFLTTNGMLDWNNHKDGSPPYEYLEPSGSDPIMQFLGRVDNALQGGSEGIYLPRLGSAWRNTSTVAVWDSTQEDVPANSPGEAAALAYGHAYGDPDKGFIVYQTSHSWQDGDDAENTAAGRTIGNMLLKTGIDKRPSFSNINIPTPIASGETVEMSMDVVGIRATFTYQWADSCGGTFSNPSGTVTAPAAGTPVKIVTDYTAPFFTDLTACVIRAQVVDVPCGRTNYLAEPITIIPATGLSLSKSVQSAEACPGETLNYTLTPEYTGIAGLSNLCVTDPIPDNTSFISASPTQTSGPDPLEWCLGSNTPGTPGVVTGGALCPVEPLTLVADADTYIAQKDGSKNFGVTNKLSTANKNSEDQVSLFHFDIDATTLPAGSVLISAELLLTNNNSENDTQVEVHEMTTAWSEGAGNGQTCTDAGVGGATWEAPNCADNWALGDFGSIDYSTTSLGTIDTSSSKTFGIDITTTVNNWLSGAGNAGLGLIPVGTSDKKIEWFAREEADSERVPRLVLRFSVPTPGGCDVTSYISKVEDTYVKEKSGDDLKNYGSSGILGLSPKLSERQYGMLRFDLSDIAVGATINSASLELTAKTNKNSFSVGIFQMLTNWSEGSQNGAICISGANWNAPNCADNWAGGGVFSSSDYSSTVLDSFTPDPKDLPFSLDVTSLVDDWVNNTVDNNGFALIAAGNTNDSAELYSSESGADAARLPTLSVDWTLAPSAASRVELIGSPLMITESGTVTVNAQITVDYLRQSTTISAPVLTPGLSAGCAAAVSLTPTSGPTPTSWVFNAPGGISDLFVYTYDVLVPPGTAVPCELSFSGQPGVVSGDPDLTFTEARSNSTILSPLLGFDVEIDYLDPSSLPTTISNQAVVGDDGAFAAPNQPLSNIVETMVGLNCPTAVTIGKIELQAVSVAAFLAELDIEQMDSVAMLDLLAVWAPAWAATLVNSNRDDVFSALKQYLDPDADGQVTVLSWETMEERGTIGFYVERKLGQAGTWSRISNRMLPGLITAPMGGEYRLADPAVISGNTYLYRLIEREARGSTRTYGPFTLEVP